MDVDRAMIGLPELGCVFKRLHLSSQKSVLAKSAEGKLHAVLDHCGGQPCQIVKTIRTPRRCLIEPWFAIQDHYIVRSEKSVDHWMHRCDKIKKAHEALLHKGLQTGDS